jgi:hypothetical protein
MKMKINNFMDILLYQIGRNSYGQGIPFKTLKIMVFIIILSARYDDSFGDFKK